MRAELTVTLRSMSVVLPTSAQIADLYDLYEDRLAPGAETPYAQLISKYRPIYLPVKVKRGRVVWRGSPFHELIWEIFFEELAEEGLHFRPEGGLDLQHYARVLGCAVEALLPFSELFEAYGRTDPSVRPFGEALWERLEIDRFNGKLVRTSTGDIDIDYYAKILDAEALLISKFRSLLRKFRAGAREKTAYGLISEERVREILERDFVACCLAESRGGKINRTYYAELLGCTKSALTPWIWVFEEYERLLGANSKAALRLAEMKDWIVSTYERREFSLRHGKLDRSKFLVHFGLNQSFLTRSSDIRSFFAELDKRAERDQYLHAGERADLERVKTWCQTQAVLLSDRLRLNLAALSTQCGVRQAQLIRSPFKEVISQFHLERRDRASRSKIDPFVHGRVFVFSDLSEYWPTEFLEKIGENFKQVAMAWTGKSTLLPHRTLFQTLDWIGRSDLKECLSVVDQARAFERIRDEKSWENALYSFRESLQLRIAVGQLKKNLADVKIRELRRSLNGLADRGGIPRLATPLPGFKNARRLTRPLPSVAEAKIPVAEDMEFRSIARNQVIWASERARTQLLQTETDAFIDNLVRERARRSDLPCDPVEAIRNILRSRLNALRDRTISIILNARSTLQYGQTFAQHADIDVSEFCERYFGSALDNSQKRSLLRANFPVIGEGDTENRQRYLANLISFIRKTRSGIPSTVRDPKFGAFLQIRMNEVGGIDQVEGLMVPTADAIAAVLTLYLIESGANVAVGRELERMYIAPSHLQGHCRVTGYKESAMGKPIIGHFPADGRLVEAMDWLKAASQVFLPSARNDAKYLFVVRLKDVIKAMTPHWFTSWFKAFSNSTPELGGLSLVPRMLRPSVLLLAALENDGRLQVGMAIGQHGLDVTQGYQTKTPTRLIYDAQVRKFQDAFETLVVSSIDGAAKKLGISEEEFDRRLTVLRDTGLGVFCKNNKGRLGNEGKPCSDLGECWSCTQMLIVAEAKPIADLIIWQEALRSVEGEWARDYPERWDAVWFPWLILADVVEENMKRDMIHIWKAAKKIVADRRKSPNFVLPMPW